MGSDEKKEMHLSILWVTLCLILAISFVPQISAQNPVIGCCILTTDGTCADVAPHTTYETQADCESFGVFKQQSCSLLENCTDICCKTTSNELKWVTKESCTQIGGTVNSALTTWDQCANQACPAGSVIIKGSVNFSDKSPAGQVKIQAINPQGISKNTTTASDGEYSVCVPSGITYTIKANASIPNKNCVAQTSVIVGSTIANAGNIILPCTKTGDACITRWTLGEWEDLENSCGRREVKDSGNCNPPTLSSKPPEYAPCPQSECGNGKIETGEECDFSASPSLPANKDQCSDALLGGVGNEGTVTCSNTCQIISKCFGCDGECSEAGMCGCSKCIAAPECIDSCKSDEDKIDPFTATGTYIDDIKGINLEWELPEKCAKSTITIKRCEADSTLSACKAGSIPVILPQLSSTITSYLDESDLFQYGTPKGYCYMITAEGQDGLNSFTITSKEIACAAIWDDECLKEPDGSFCDGKSLVVCSLGKKQDSSVDNCECGCMSDKLNQNAQCVEPAQGAAEGAGPLCNVCDICSGPFGLYPYKFRFYDLSSIYSNYQSCDQTMYFEGGDGTCFIDDYSSRKSIIGQVHACADISSCYDYRTKDSCLSNPCSIVEAANCDWKGMSDEADEELGIGACVPEDEELQDCTKCNNNVVFGKYCPESLCVLYGSESGPTKCYHNKEVDYRFLKFDNVSCLNAKDVACETYDTIEECVGEELPAGEGEGSQAFSANVKYNEDGVRIGIDNEILSESNDLLGKGKCIWLAETSKCIKDSDSSFDATQSLDCFVRTGQEPCFTDFETPQTTVFVLDVEMQNDSLYSKEELRRITFEVSEASYATYASISRPDAIIYPDQDVDSFGGKARFNSDYVEELTDGDYVLNFYSEDKAKNIEQVQSIKFKLIPDIENIPVSIINSTAYYQSSDEYLTNVSVSISHTDLTCLVSLTDAINRDAVFMGDGLKESPALQWQYAYIQDGNYVLHVSCADSHLQTFGENYLLSYDGDISIHDSKPRGETFGNEDVEIELKTEYSANCYYTEKMSALDDIDETKDDLSLSSDWKKYDVTDGLVHKATIPASKNTETKMHHYFSACYFDKEEWHIGNNGDVIFYAVDTLPPELIVIDMENNAPYVSKPNSIDAVEEINLLLKCNDSTPLLDTGYAFDFGCGNESIKVVKRYASYATPEQQLKVFGPELFGNMDVYTATSPAAPYSFVRVYLNITATDLGGNSKESAFFLNIRNLSFEVPQAVICDPFTAKCT